jgi:Ca2+-binding RTX toxin-like protein
MATYKIHGKGITLFQAQGLLGGQLYDFDTNLLYVTSTSIGYENPDGSRTYFTGTGFVWDPVARNFSAGTITSIQHYTNDILFDEVTGLNAPAATFWSNPNGQSTSGVIQLFSESAVLAGNDMIDARVRANNEVIDTVLRGYTGNDTIYGGRGNDTLQGDEGNDSLNGGDGNDLLLGGAGSDTLVGGNGNDTLFGGNDNSVDVLSGDAGNDKLFTFNGNDTLNGGTGNDLLSSNLGADKLNGGDGDDVLTGGSNSILYRGTGTAPLYAENDTISGGNGVDTVTYHTLFENLKIVKTTTGFTVTDYNATDTLTGVERIATDNGTFEWNATTSTWNRINWKSSLELLNGSAEIYGTDLADTLNLSGTINPITGIAEGRIANVFGGNDTVNGSTGADVISGGLGSDVLSGQNGNDRLYGGDDNDTLRGGEGTDILNGGWGNDVLDGGFGNDILTGGGGADNFYFQYINGPERAWGKDIVTDFQVGVDTITLDWGPRLVTNTLALTTDGWLLTSTDASNTSNTVLFKDLKTPGLTVDNLLFTPAEIFTGTAGADTKTENYGPTTSPVRLYNLLDGNDTLTFQSGSYQNVKVFAGNGDDRIEAINTTIGNIRTSANGVFTFDGGAGNDTLIGGRANDTLLGGDGNDNLVGGEGNDVMWGGAGADTFRFGSTVTGQRGTDVYFTPPGSDTIKDFQVGLDKLSVGINATIVDTASGIVVTSSYVTSQILGLGSSYGTATVLLEGIHGTYTAADLFV